MNYKTSCSVLDYCRTDSNLAPGFIGCAESLGCSPEELSEQAEGGSDSDILPGLSRKNAFLMEASYTHHLSFQDWVGKCCSHAGFCHKLSEQSHILWSSTHIPCEPVKLQGLLPPSVS